MKPVHAMERHWWEVIQVAKLVPPLLLSREMVAGGRMDSSPEHECTQ